MIKDEHIKSTFCENAKVPKASEKKLEAMALDIDYYQAFLDDVDISDDQKIELIETLWEIVVNFIELGFQIHPLNISQSGRAKDETSQALERVIGDFASDALGILNDYEDEQVAGGLPHADAPPLVGPDDAPINDKE